MISKAAPYRSQSLPFASSLRADWRRMLIKILTLASVHAYSDSQPVIMIADVSLPGDVALRGVAIGVRPQRGQTRRS
jgi:hypothetical protein